MFAKFKIPFKVIFKRFKQLSFFVSILLSKKRENKKFSNGEGYKAEKMQPQKKGEKHKQKNIKKN